MKQALKQTKKNLEFIRQSGNPHWNIDAQTGAFLQQKIVDCKAKRVLEIGTSIGISALWMVEPLMDQAGHLTTVESHAERYSAAKENFVAAEVTDYITQVHGHAPEILPEIAGTFDLLFFDATKMEHIEYYKALKDRLNTGGYLIADNVLSHAESMQPFVDAVRKDTSFDVSIEDIGTGLLVALKH